MAAALSAVSFQRLSAPKLQVQLAGDDRRPPEQREQVRLRNNAVTLQLPGTAAHAQVVVPDEDVVVFGVAVQHQPHPAGADVWMHYGALADITAWAQFLDSALDTMAQALGAAQTATR